MIAIKEMRERLDWKPNVYIIDNNNWVRHRYCPDSYVKASKVATRAIYNMMGKSDK